MTFAIMLNVYWTLTCLIHIVGILYIENRDMIVFKEGAIQ